MFKGLTRIHSLKDLYDRGYEIDAFTIAAFDNGFDVFLSEETDDIFAICMPE